jgi:type II secretory pathway pseudopilin PulG
MHLHARRGQSLIELLIGIAVGAIFMVGAATIIVPSLKIGTQATAVQEEAQLGQELLNNVKAWSNGNWGSVLSLATGTANDYYLNTATSPFTAVGTSTTGESISFGGAAGGGGGYSYSRAITVNSNASGTQTNFPMLFSGTYSWLEPVSTGGRIQNLVAAPNGETEPADLIFTSDPGCSSPLNFETESYSSSTGAINDWVNASSLSAGTVIYACYGNASVTTDQSHPSATWNSNYEAVYHFPSVSNFGIDSTVNGFSLSTSTASSSVGRIDGSASFNGSTQNMIVNHAVPGAFPYTMQSWVKLSTTNISSEFRWMSMNNPGIGEYGWVEYLPIGQTILRMVTCVSFCGTYYDARFDIPSLDTNWHDIVAVFNSASSYSLYFDGQPLNSFQTDGAPNTMTNPNDISLGGVAGGAEFPGMLDETRFTTNILTPSWILTEYNNQSSPSSFYTVGNENTPAEYKYYRAITVGSNASGTQTNFPMLISGTYSWLEASSTGGRIQNIVTAPNGGQEPADLVFATTTPTQGPNGWNCPAPLNFETERYSSSTGAINDWVNVHSLSAGSVIYACYGNSLMTTDQSHPALTWNSNYGAVYHYPSGSSFNANDSTANANNPSSVGSVVSGSGQIDGGASNAASSYITIPHSNSINPSSLTFSMWTNINSSEAGQEAIPAGISQQSYAYYASYILEKGPGDLMDFSITGSSNNPVEVFSSSTVAFGTWQNWVGTYDGSHLDLYLNGVLQNSTSTNISIWYNNQSLGFGDYGSTGYAPINMLFDETRVSDVALSPSWILTEYNNQSSPSSFYTFGSEQMNGGGSTATIPATYHRYFYLSDVYRDANGAVTSTVSGNYFDPSTKLATVVVNVATSTAAPLTYSLYITRSGDNALSQTTWSGGGGQSAPVTFVSSTYFSAVSTTVTGAGSLQLNGTGGSSSGYSYARAITVTSTTSIASGTQANFPMLVSATLSSWASVSHGGHVQNLVTAPNGGTEPADLVFATSTANCSSSPLSFETESYSSSTGALVDWVNVPSLSAGSVIYACYGNASVTTDQSHPSSTWNSNYVAVYHLATPTSTLNVKDSTGNYNGTNNSVAASSTGQIDGAGAFDGSSQYVDVAGLNNIITYSAMSVEAWFWVNNISAGPNGRIMANAHTDADGTGFQFAYSSGGSDVFFGVGGVGGTGVVHMNDNGNPLTSNKWYFAAGTYDGTNLKGYVTGKDSSYAASTGSGAVKASALDLNIGRNPSYAGDFVGGTVDEVRISKVALTPSWILTEYNNQSSPANFYAVGSEQTGSSGYVATSTLDSATFDTRSPLGAQLNSVTWYGSALNSTAVGLQLAVSTSSSGPWTFEGPSGDGTTYFTGIAGSSIPLVSNIGGAGYAMFSGYRYFRYRVLLFSDSTHTHTPTVTGVNVNWSP